MTVSISSYASAHGWANDTIYNELKMNEVITITATGGAYTGKYFTSGTNWRLYMTDSGKFTMTAADGYTIVSASFVYTVSNYGVLVYDGTQYKSGAEIPINSDTAEFSASRTSGSKQGQVRVSSITVVYQATGGDTPDCQHTGGSATCTKQAVCDLCGQPYGDLAAHDFSAGGATCANSNCSEPNPDYYAPITIEQALSATVGDKVQISGTVESVDTPWSDEHNNITVTITDGTHSIQLYRLATNVVRGDVITVKGVIGSYNSNNQIAAGATATITGHDSSYDEIEYTEVGVTGVTDCTNGDYIKVTGTVVEIDSAKKYTYIADENGNRVLIYNYDGDVSVKQVITVYGQKGEYQGAVQIQNVDHHDDLGTHTCSKYNPTYTCVSRVCVVCGTTAEPSTDHVFENGECACGELEVIPTYDVHFSVPAKFEKPATQNCSSITLPGVGAIDAYYNAYAYVFVGWAKAAINGSTTTSPTIYKAGDTVAITEETTFYAVFSYSAGESAFVKVTENLDDWSGDYLIVYEAESFAFNGSLETLDATNNYITVSINNGSIAASEDNKNYKFTITKDGDIYYIMSASGYYIGQTSNDNKLLSKKDTKYTNSISWNGESVDIICSGGAYMRFNTTSGQDRFRYFKSSSYTNQEEITLYKLQSGTTYVTTLEHEHDFSETWTKNEDAHWHECSCGEKSGEAAHKAATKTDCTANTVCSVCNYKIADGNAQHSWSDWTSTGETEHKHTCQNPGCNAAETANHTESTAANCTTSAYCDVCNSNYGSANINNHTYGTLIAKKGATCTVDGMKAHYHCGCGSYFDENKVATTAEALKIAASHTYGDWNNGVSATCTSTGTKAHQTCSVCSKHFDINGTEILDLTIAKDASNHTYGTLVEKVDANCTKNGMKAHYHCGCGSYFDENKVATTAAELKINKTGHTFTHTEQKAATCTEPGNKGYVHCSKCDTYFADSVLEKENGGKYVEGGTLPNAFESTYIIPAGHKYSEWIPVDPATCTGEGTLGHYHCDKCGKNFDAEKNGLDSLVIPALTHSFTNYVSKDDATCTADGTKTATCDRVGCGEKDTVTIENSKLGHKLSGTSFYRVDDAKLYTVTQCERYGQGGCTHEVKTEVGVANVATEADLRLALEAGYSVKLTADIELSKGCIKITKGNEISINLNGKSIINNGVLKNNVIDVLWVCGDIDVTISGGGAMKALGVEKGKSTCVLSATDGATVVIENGSYYSDGCTTIFATRGSEIAINGGHFEAADASYLVDIDEREEGKPISTIVITGGEFVDFNPANHSNDGAANSNKLPDGYHSIKSGNVYTVGAHDYTYNEKVVDPTCEADGYTRHTCVCEDYYDDTPVAKLGHKDEKHDHVCDNGCGVAQGTHAENNAHKCTYCGQTEAEWICRGGEATCTEKAICTVCGNAYGKALGHDFSNGHTCSRCGSEGVAKIGNTYYLDIQDAFDALQAGDTLVFNSHITLTDSIVISVSATLDTGDYVVTSTAREVIVINGEGVELTVNGKFVVSNTSAALMRTGGGSNVQTILTIEDVNNVTVILNAEFDLGAEDILYSGDVKSGYSISVKAEYAAHLARFGYVTTAGAGDRVNVVERSPYYIGANGNWYMNGFDTGIKAEGQNGQNIVIDRVVEGDKVDNATIYTIYFNIGEPVVLTVYHGKPGNDGRGIASIAVTDKEANDKLVAKVVTITYTKALDNGEISQSFEIPCGQDGQNGKDITIVGDPDVSHNSVANTTTYTVNFSNGTKLSFTVKHGAQGEEGNGIKSIVISGGEKGGVKGQWITIYYTKADAEGKSEETFFIPHGVDGKPGSSVTVDTGKCTSSYDQNTNSTTYTVYFTDNNYISFTVHHGTNGTDGNGISYVSVENGKHEGKDGQWITINYTKGESTEFFVPNGVNGGKGDSITIVGEPEVDHDVVKNSTKYTVNFSNGNSVSFTVQHGVDGKDGNGVKGIQVATDLENNGQWITIYYTKADAEGKSEETFFVPNGVNGTDGNGIDYVETDVDSKGNVLITINYTKSEAITVTIPKGDKGNGIQAIVSEVGTKDGVAGQWITITYTEGSETTKLFVPNGKDGANVTITKTEKTTVESVDTYTITFSDGTTVSFSVTHGIDGDKGDKGDQGDQGEAGKTPYIGENGNWWIGDKDLGIPATGSDGDSGETPYIGENGNWWIGETDTGIKAQGEDGRSNDVIILFTVGIAALCLLTTIVAVVTRKGRRSWWFIL